MNSYIAIAVLLAVASVASADSFKGQQQFVQSESQSFKGQLPQQQAQQPAEQQTFQAPAQLSVKGSPIKSMQQSVTYEPIKSTYQAPAPVQEQSSSEGSFKGAPLKGQYVEATRPAYYQAPVQASYEAPVKSSYQAPVKSYEQAAAPVKSTYQAPVQQTYTYQAPVQATYQAPVQTSYTYEPLRMPMFFSRPVYYQAQQAVKSMPLRYESVKGVQQVESFKGVAAAPQQTQQMHYQAAEPIKAAPAVQQVESFKGQRFQEPIKALPAQQSVQASQDLQKHL